MNGVYAVPETRQGIANLWLLLEGEEYLKTFVVPDRDQSLITAMIKESDSEFMTQVSLWLSGFLAERTSNRIVTLDPARLSSEGREALEQVRLSEAALQLSWLAQGYDKPREYHPDAFLEKTVRRVPEPGPETRPEPSLEGLQDVPG